MSPIAVLSVAVLFAAGAYMLLRRSMVKLVIGLVLVGHAANLLIFAAARPERGRPALVERGADAPAAPYSDPLPAALVLTAIVIGFSIVSYTIVLIRRAYEDAGTDDLKTFTSTDR